MSGGARVPGHWPYARIVAHRGGGTLAPENTLAGMREAHARGFGAVEFDVMLAADGVPVLMHDPRLGRTVAGTGGIDTIDSGRLAAMDAGGWFDARFRGELVPLFADTLRWLREHGVWPNIEIKPYPGRDVHTGRIVAQLAAAAYAGEDDVARRPLMSSFSEAALEAARDAVPDLPRGLLVDAVPHDWQRRAQALGVVSLHCNHEALTEAQAARIKDAGYGLLCYTVNDPARARALFDWGVDALCTDRLDLIGPGFR